ncbi:MAG: hypothetical protein K2V38_18015, partial [Gemmataceae bacterium]|nr:hypothetical protein [Gemmataceae bacterium]
MPEIARFKLTDLLSDAGAIFMQFLSTKYVDLVARAPPARPRRTRGHIRTTPPRDTPGTRAPTRRPGGTNRPA